MARETALDFSCVDSDHLCSLNPQRFRPSAAQLIVIILVALKDNLIHLYYRDYSFSCLHAYAVAIPSFKPHTERLRNGNQTVHFLCSAD